MALSLTAPGKLNPSPVERLILDNQQVMLYALRALLLHDRTGITRAADAVVEDQIGTNAAALKKD